MAVSTLEELRLLLRKHLIDMENLWIENQLLRDFMLRKLPHETVFLLEEAKIHPDWREKAKDNFAEQWKALEEAFRLAVVEEMPTSGKPN